ncbi:MAG: AAA family ATPase, partial [Candidatus Aramenus sulfurataquae]|nr:AAA family ATPase [Candidatus Aramenus sulfurataquae]
MRASNEDSVNRIDILGIEGGVEKSIVALTLGKALAINSKNVLIIDGDAIGYSSYILGIRGKGILSKLVDGEEDFDSSFKEIALNEGFLGIIKLFGDGDRFENDIATIHENKDLRDKFSSLYRKFLLYRKYDYYIVDNPPMI